MSADGGQGLAEPATGVEGGVGKHAHQNNQTALSGVAMEGI